MKKLFSFVLVVTLFTACNSGSNSSANEMKNADSSNMKKENAMGSDSMNHSSMDMKAQMKEGSMMMMGGKMAIIKNGKPLIMTEETTCSDGCKVKPNGEVIMKDGKTMMMKDGDVIDQDGNMTSAGGKPMMMMNHDSM
jgi:hypothetical protein